MQTLEDGYGAGVMEKITIRDNELKPFLAELKEKLEDNIKVRTDYKRCVNLIMWVFIGSLVNATLSFFHQPLLMVIWTIIYLLICLWLFSPIYKEFKRTMG